jgi:hypothetical protein
MSYFYTLAGQRVFNVVVNGVTVLAGFDVNQAAGGQLRAVVEQFNTTANSTGQIVVQFVGLVDSPIINGIEVLTGTSGS